MPFDGSYYDHEPDLMVLREARRLLAKRSGWQRRVFHTCQKRWFGTRHSFCVVGAIYFVAGRSQGERVISQHLYPVLPYELAVYNTIPPTWNVIHFNDAQASKWPVLQLMDRAIAKLENTYAP